MHWQTTFIPLRALESATTQRCRSFSQHQKTLNKIFLKNYKQNTLKEKNYLNEKKNFGKITQKNNKVIFDKYSNNIARIQKLDYL